MKSLIMTIPIFVLMLAVGACTFVLDQPATSSLPASGPASVAEREDIAPFAGPWETATCDTFNLPDVIAEISDCGYVTVPELHSQPDGPTIQVAVVRTRSTGESPAPDPFFMEQGGPGGSTLHIFPGAALPALAELQNILATRDMVFVEQRGTFYSRPSLTCPEKVDHDIEVAKGALAEADLSWVTACHDRLLTEGVNFSAFNSIENATDMYFVAETLGYNSFNFYGTSYGTLLAQYLMDQAGDHAAQLRTVTIDAVVTSNIDFDAAASATISYALRNLFAECAQDEQCNQAFPELETLFLALVDQLNEEPVPATLTVVSEAGEPLETIDTTLNGEDFVLATFALLYGNRNNRTLPLRIYQASQNHDFAWVAENKTPGYEAVPEAKGMHIPVVCARANSLTFDATTLFDAPYEQLAFLGPSASDEVKRQCELIPIELEEPFVLDNTDIPTLILNGTRDPITPQPYGEYVGNELSTAYVYTIPGSGHGSLLNIPCSGQIVLDFLTMPDQEPASNCISERQPPFEYGE